MPEFSNNLWAPWRMEYIRSIEEEQESGCFLCRYWDAPQQDRDNHVIWRGRSAFAVMNRFPYTAGHLLIAHATHQGDLTDLTDEQLTEMTRLTRDGVALLRKTLRPQGFNVGYNIGHCAGAGLPGHLHLHIVPRWTGDTNFMAIVGDIHMVPESLEALYDQLVNNAAAAGLR